MLEGRIKKRRTVKNSHSKTFEESLTIFNKDWNDLSKRNELSEDAKFLRRMALNIKQIYHDIKQSKHPKELEIETIQLLDFFSTPIDSSSSLLEAVDTFSQQEPLHSDLSAIMKSLASRLA